MSADATDLYRLSRNLENIALQIEQLAPQLADARTVREYDADRKRNLLAEFVTPLLATEKSATAAETVARANPEYRRRFDELRQQLLTAHTVIAREGGLQARFEAARSVLSVTKAQLAL
jgi:hypothetical protein